MSLGVTKECFSPASMCHNCKRKRRDEISEKTDERKEFLRCSGCHLLTYCDKHCQTEHWQKVHKRHCKFLSGRKLLNNSMHMEDTCTLCIDEKNATVGEILDIKSPKTRCHIKLMVKTMKEVQGSGFGFHREGKTCKCSLDFPCELPLPLGEVCGKYIDKGLDGMLAHALKIVGAMGTKDIWKDSNDNGAKKGTLIRLWRNLIAFRSGLWGSVLVAGVSKSRDEKVAKKYLTDPVKELKVYYGTGNAWWKALMFAHDNIIHMNEELNSDIMDTNSIRNSMYKNFKLIQDYNQSQSRNQEYVDRNNLWPKFQLWPSLAGASLVILLPEGTRCHACNSALSGQVIVTEDEVVVKVSNNEVILTDGEGVRSRPMLMSRLGEHGELVACCSVPRCFRECFYKDVKLSSQADEEKSKEILEETKAFLVQSRDCDVCLKRSLSSHRCSKCYAAQYCSTQCQGEDLKFHKTVCSIWAKDKFRKIISAKQQKKIVQSQVDEYVPE